MYENQENEQIYILIPEEVFLLNPENGDHYYKFNLMYQETNRFNIQF